MSMLESIRNSFGLSPTKASRSPEKATAIGTVTSPKKQEESLRDNPVYGYLVLESNRGVETQRFPIRKRITTVGRLQSCDIRIYEETISRLHCQICVDDAGKLTLQIFNPRGVRLNEQRIQKVASASSTPNVYPLQTADLIELFAHRFRLEAPNATGDLPCGSKGKTGRKSLRMSLSSVPNSQNSGIFDRRGEDRSGKLSNPIKQDDVFSDDLDKENVPIKKGHHSTTATLLGKTALCSAPGGQGHNLSPVKVVVNAEREEEAKQNHSIAVMEEVDNEEEGTPTDQPLVEPQTEIEQKKNEESEAETPVELSDPPASLPIAADRLTQSCSPKKKKRRSSFFGRAGIFAGINFGFYPEERKNSQEEAMVEGNILTSVMHASPSSPGRMQRDMTPEPPLDVHGRPRLPRSLSSPSGVSCGSPGKRRVISLRTATLIRSGQIAFEQKKMLSPPLSPTKGTFSSLSLPPLASSTSPEKEPTKSVASAEETLVSPEKEEEDAFDADEVDKSLSSLMNDDDMEEEEERKPIPQPNFSAVRDAKKARKSHGGLRTASKRESKGRTRNSLPGKTGALSEGEQKSAKLVNEWRKEWQEQKKQASQQMRQDECAAEAAQETSVVCYGAEEERREIEADPESSGNGSILLSSEESDGAAVLPAPSSSYSMLRHMVRDSPALNVLLDRVTKSPDAARIEAQTSQDLFLLEPSLLELTEADFGEQTDRAEDISPEAELQDSCVKELPSDSKEKRTAKIHFVNTRPSRRVSESTQGRQRRRSSTSGLATGRKPRKSAAAILPSAAAIERRLPEGDIVTESASPEKAAPAEAAIDVRLLEEVDEVVGLPMPPAPPKKAERQKRAESCSPRKRVADVTVEVKDADQMTRPGRAAKIAAAAAIVGEGASLRERQESASPQKSLARHARSISREPSSDQPNMDELLVLGPSSPVKRVKRAARNNAEEKIRAVLTKKPSIAALRDARTLSETGTGLAKANSQADQAAATTPAAASFKPKASRAPRTRIPAKVVEKTATQSRSEPSTRTTRSRAAKK